MSTVVSLEGRSATTSRVPPHNREAEAALLGAMLITPAAIATASERLVASDFYDLNHGHVFAAITALSNTGQPADAVTVADELSRLGLLDQIGGKRALADIMDTPAPGNARRYADIIARDAALRNQIALLGEATEAAYNGHGAAVTKLATDAAALHHAPPVRSSLVDWSTFWAKDRNLTDWALEPLWPRGRATNQYAPRGTGKSELILFGAAAMATGRAVLGRSAGDPLSVVYLDLEMTEDDLFDRLTDLGYGGSDDLSGLAYYLLPDLPPLDTPEGGAAVMDLVRTHGADVVVVDTIARAVAGEENSNDTFNQLASYTIRRLKAEGVTSVWAGHAGKDMTRGERGASSKADYVDCVWEQTRGDGGSVRLANKKRRSSWVPEQVDLQRVEQGGRITYVTAADSWPEGTGRVADALDRLGASQDITRRAAAELLRANDIGGRNEVVSAALKWRRNRPAGAR